MKKCVRATLAISTMILSACSPVDSVRVFDNEQAARVLQQHYTARPTRQRIAINSSSMRGWQRIDLSFGTVGSPIMLVPPHQTFSDWTQNIRTQIRAYYHFPDITAKQFVAEQIQQAKQRCAIVDAEILQQSSSYYLYQLNMAQCRNEKNRFLIGKAFNGIDAVYVVYYTAKTDDVTKPEIQKMSRVIMSAKLVARM
jgi:hypothetical protein